MSRERLLELLADEALGELAAEDRPELDRLRTLHPDVSENALLDVVCALEESGPRLEPPYAPLPAALRARLRDDANAFFRAMEGATLRSEAGVHAPPVRSPAARPDPRRGLATFGWLAAAAGWTLVVLSWLGGGEGPPRAGPTPEASFAAVAAAPDALRVPFSAGSDAAGVAASGEVLWSNVRQEGYLRLRGLAPNDPRTSQYQLWIFDAKRNEAHPVDGGVFDVAGDGETLVPIRAKLAVFEPSLFAVTVEPPGGVVVSSRERIALLGRVGG